MAAKLEKAIPEATVELIRGSGGVFTVIAGGREVWNKHEAGDFPNEDSLVGTISALS